MFAKTSDRSPKLFFWSSLPFATALVCKRNRILPESMPKYEAKKKKKEFRPLGWGVAYSFISYGPYPFVDGNTILGHMSVEPSIGSSIDL